MWTKDPDPVPGDPKRHDPTGSGFAAILHYLGNRGTISRRVGARGDKTMVPTQLRYTTFKVYSGSNSDIPHSRYRVVPTQVYHTQGI